MPQAASVTTVKAVAGPMERRITAVGGLEAEEEVRIAAEVAGRVTTVAFDEGDVVESGGLLVAVDRAAYEFQVQDAEAKVEKLAAQLAMAQDTFDRWKVLKDAGKITAQEYQEHETELAKAKADLAGARSALGAARTQLGNTQVRVPHVKGKKVTFEVQERSVAVGEYLSPGKVVAQLVGRATLNVVFPVPEEDARFVAVGQEVRFTVPAVPDREFAAEVYYISPKADTASRSIVVKARAANGEKLLRAGYSALVAVEAEKKAAAVKVPTEAVLFDEKGYFVFTVAGGKAQRRPVKVGIQEELFTEIVEGVAAGEEIVRARGPMLKEGTPVQVVEGAKADDAL